MADQEADSQQFRQHVVGYILELRGQGHFLPYQDYEIVADWIKAAGSEDDLLIVLSETLPEFFVVPAGSKPKSLSSVHKKVLKALKTRAMMR
jgi:hypothetical protein